MYVGGLQTDTAASTQPPKNECSQVRTSVVYGGQHTEFMADRALAAVAACAQTAVRKAWASKRTLAKSRAPGKPPRRSNLRAHPALPRL